LWRTNWRQGARREQTRPLTKNMLRERPTRRGFFLLWIGVVIWNTLNWRIRNIWIWCETVRRWSAILWWYCTMIDFAFRWVVVRLNSFGRDVRTLLSY
jgi:hypothetical protein